MSTMATPDAVPGRVLAEMRTCERCEPTRKPRMLVCDYHAGWWDGWEARTEGAEQ